MKTGSQEWNNIMFKKHATPNKGLAGWIEKQRHKEIIQVINDLIKVDNPLIIEIGCEAGNLLVEIEKEFPNANINGCDISNNALAQALLKLNNTSVFYHDITDEPFRNHNDVIICSEVLEHIPSPKDEKAITNIAKTANKDSIVIITVPYEKIKNIVKKILKYTGLMKILFKGVEEGFSEWHVQDYSKKEICNKLEKHFEIIHYENILMLHQMIVCKVRK